jgi:hypothetical protein
MVLINPFGTGVATILVLTGVGLMVLGSLLCWLSMKLRTIHSDLGFDYE